VGEAAALVAAFTWSATSVWYARLAVSVTPVALSALRLVFASLALPAVLLVSGEAGDLSSAPVEAIIAMVGSGLLAYAIGDTLYFAALARMGIQQTFTITMALFILLTVAGGIIWLDEEFTWLQALGAALVAVGIALVVTRRAAANGTNHANPALPRLTQGELSVGYALIVLVGVFWAAATLWLADGRGEMGSIAASVLRTPAGAVGMVAFGLATAPRDLRTPFADRRTIWGIVAVAMIGTLFGSLLYVYAVGEAGPGKTSILNACAPLLALPLSVAFLKEPLTKLVLAGTIICVAGIVFVVA
jgi:drug/metabolite transporter (DMT)-like permease